MKGKLVPWDTRWSLSDPEIIVPVNLRLFQFQLKRFKFTVEFVRPLRRPYRKGMKLE